MNTLNKKKLTRRYFKYQNCENGYFSVWVLRDEITDYSTEVFSMNFTLKKIRPHQFKDYAIIYQKTDKTLQIPFVTILLPEDAPY